MMSASSSSSEDVAPAPTAASAASSSPPPPPSAPRTSGLAFERSDALVEAPALAAAVFESWDAFFTYLAAYQASSFQVGGHACRRAEYKG